MWRIGVLLCLSGVFLVHTYPTDTNDVISQRLKRSPYYDCAPFPPHRPRFFPPYPPPPPPPGPPPFYHQQQSQTLSQAESQAQASSGSHTEASSRSQAQASSASQSQGISGTGSHGFNGANNQGECDTCSGKQNSAISNAQSETGDAVAIAISKNH